MVFIADSKPRQLLELFVEGIGACKPSKLLLASFSKILSTCSGFNGSMLVLRYLDLMLASVKVLSKVG